MILYILLLLVLVLIVVLVPMARKYLKTRRDRAELQRTVHECADKYSFLVDRQFRVKETNFYELNIEQKDDQPSVLGNVLHCQTGCDSGLCGTGIACATCPVRMVLSNAFKMKRDFSSVMATMRLYDASHQVHEVGVKVDGTLVYLGTEPHFIVQAEVEPELEPKHEG